MYSGNTPNGDAATYQSDAGQNQGTTQQATDQVKQAAGQMQEQAGKVLDQAQQQVTTQATAQKEQATKSLSTVAQAVRQASDHLRQNDQTPIAQYTDMAAERIDSAASYLRTHDVSDIVDEVQSFAQRQPALFLTGAFALGLLATRFLKSSGNGQRAQSRGRHQLMQRGPTTGGSYGQYPAGYGTTSGDTSGYVTGYQSMPPTTIRGNR